MENNKTIVLEETICEENFTISVDMLIKNAEKRCPIMIGCFPDDDDRSGIDGRDERERRHSHEFEMP